MLLQKRQHALEKEMLPLKPLKDKQPHEEENVLLVEKAALREKAVRRKAALREKAEPREKAALREKLLREKAALRNEEEDKRYLPLISPFYFFNQA